MPHGLLQRTRSPLFLFFFLFFRALPFFQFTWAILVSIHGLVGFSFRLVGCILAEALLVIFSELLCSLSSGLASDLLIPCSVVYFFRGI